MNREEISKEFEIKFNGLYSCHSITKISAIKFVEHILKKSQQWNMDSTPDISRNVLVLVNDPDSGEKYVRIGVFNGDYFVFDDGFGDVIGWQELPPVE